MQINVLVSIVDVATMAPLCQLTLASLLDGYRATIIERIQPICHVSDYGNCQPPHLNDRGPMILEYQIKSELRFHLHVGALTPFPLSDFDFEFHSVSSVSMANHQQMNSVGGDVCRVLHVIMHIKIP